MTCRYSNVDWLDVLYNGVRRAGGVVKAAQFLSERRGRSIHPESLRAKLRGVNGDEISVPMALLLTEWMEEQAAGADCAKDWILALCASEAIAADPLPPDEDESAECAITAIQTKVMRLSELAGKASGAAVRSTLDRRIDPAERDELVGLARQGRALLHRFERRVVRTVQEG